MKKILVDLLPLNNDQFNGVEHFIKSTLSELENSTYLVFLHKSKFPLKKILPAHYNNYSSIKIPITASIYLRIILEQILLSILSFKYDLIYIPFNAGPIIKSKKCELIITIHDLLPFSDKCKYFIIRKYYLRWITFYSYRMAKSIVTVSNTTRANIQNLFGMGKEIHVFYNSVMPLEKKPEFISKSYPYLLILGGVNKDKNIDKILIGFRYFLNTNNDPLSQSLKILVAGADQGFVKKMQNLILELNLINNVEYLGYISSELKNQLLSGCRSLFMLGNEEGFGIPALELLQHSKLPIIINRGALPEICGKFSICINTYDEAEISNAIYQAMNSSDEFDKLALSEYLSHFKTQLISKNFINIVFSSP